MGRFAFDEGDNTGDTVTTDASLVNHDTAPTTPNMTTTIVSLPAAAGSAGYGQFKPRATVTASGAAEPSSAITATGWVSTPKATLSALQNLSAIAAGTWTLSGTWSLGGPWTGSFTIGMRAWQVAIGSSITASSSIPLPGADANGWVYTSTITPGTNTSGTFTLTLASTSAVSLSTSTPYLWIELICHVTATGAVGVALHPSGVVLTVPATTFPSAISDTLTTSDAPTRQSVVSRSIAETLTTSDSVTRQFVGTRSLSESLITSDAPVRGQILSRSASESLTTSDAPARSFTGSRSTTESLTTTDAPTRVQNSNRAVAESLSTSETPTRRIFAARTVNEALTTTEAPTRAFVGSRSVNESLSTSDSVGSVRNLQRTVYDDLVPADWHGVIYDKAISGITRDSAGNVVGSATVKLFRQSDDFMVAQTTSHATTGAYSFSRDRFDPNLYYVLATKADTPEIHGVSDRGLVPA